MTARRSSADVSRSRRAARRGQAALETMMMMVFLCLMVFGLMHLSIYVVHRSVLNYAAFAAARAEMVTGSAEAARDAAGRVMGGFRWWRGAQAWRNVPAAVDVGDRRVTVTSQLPFYAPIYSDPLGGGVWFEAATPRIGQSFHSGGDND